MLCNVAMLEKLHQVIVLKHSIIFSNSSVRTDIRYQYQIRTSLVMNQATVATESQCERTQAAHALFFLYLSSVSTCLITTSGTAKPFEKNTVRFLTSAHKLNPGAEPVTRGKPSALQWQSWTYAHMHARWLKTATKPDPHPPSRSAWHMAVEVMHIKSRPYQLPDLRHSVRFL